MGCTIKLLCIASSDRRGDAVSVRVHPAMIPRTHPLASVGDAFNAVFVEAEAAGQLMFYGRGAGGAPTASAVLGDLVAVARNRLSGARAPSESAYADAAVRPIGEVVTRYHVCLDVADRAGVLATVAGVFARHGVSIATVQPGRAGRRRRPRDRHAHGAPTPRSPRRSPNCARSTSVQGRGERSAGGGGPVTCGEA